MGAYKRIDKPSSLLVDYDCNRRCQVEVDLLGHGALAQLREVAALADTAHAHAHAAPDPERHHKFSDTVLVRSAVPVAA